MKERLKFLGVLVFVAALGCTAQKQQAANSKTYLERSWKDVATKMPDDWYGSDEAKAVAENVLFSQHDIGGWSKNKPYHHPLSEADKAQVAKDKSEIGATFDNGATVTEMMFLAKIYGKSNDSRYATAFEKAFSYILQAQYENGGWPQFYPFRKGKTIAYNSHITYNDNAMVNVMVLLKEIANENPSYASLPITDEMRKNARRAFEKGVDCILKTQIKVGGQPTVWCAQHDEFTFAPANARAYELVSFSGAESVGITQLLMEIDHPTKEIVAAVKGAVKWFEEHKLTGIKLTKETGVDGKPNTVVVADPAAAPLWARFYDLETGKPYFCDRDGIKKNTLAEIGYERRNGYSWYTNSPEKILSKYPEWASK
ncbi:MAG: pectate lyase [Bacteroidota bacterium]